MEIWKTNCTSEKKATFANFFLLFPKGNLYILTSLLLRSSWLKLKTCNYDLKYCQNNVFKKRFFRYFLRICVKFVKGVVIPKLLKAASCTKFLLNLKTLKFGQISLANKRLASSHILKFLTQKARICCNYLLSKRFGKYSRYVVETSHQNLRLS